MNETKTRDVEKTEKQLANVLELVDQLARYGDWRDGETAELILDALDGKPVRFRR